MECSGSEVDSEQQQQTSERHCHRGLRPEPKQEIPTVFADPRDICMSERVICEFLGLDTKNKQIKENMSELNQLVIITLIFQALMSVTPNPPRLFTKFDTNKPCARCSEKNERIAVKIDECACWE